MILFGAIFAALESPHLQKSVFLSGYFWHGLVFTTVFNVAVFYAILTYPDWMWMYFIDGVKLSGAELLYIFIFFYYLPYVLGYYLGFDLKKRSSSLWVLFVIFLIASEASIIAHLFDRYSVVGTRADYLNGTAVSLFGPQNPIGPVMNGSVVVMILYFIVVLLIKKRSRKTLSLS